jgi:hypothetical protein
MAEIVQRLEAAFEWLNVPGNVDAKGSLGPSKLSKSCAARVQLHCHDRQLSTDVVRFGVSAGSP